MSARLQQIVDALGDKLQRSVAIDDTALRLLAYSPHQGPVDQVRYDSIMQREVGTRVQQWALSQGIASATGPVRLPEHKGLGILPRLVIPVRCQGLLLGYLILIEGETPVTDGAITQAEAAAEAAGTVLYQEQLLAELERGRERELLRDLLSGNPTVAAPAASELREIGLAPAAGEVSAVVVRASSPDASESARTAMSAALNEVRRTLSPRHCLHLTRPDHGVLLVHTRDPSLRADGLAEFGATLHAATVRALGDRSGERVLVGIGDPEPALAEVDRSYRQALKAIDVLTIVPTFGDVAAWSALGVYRTLCLLPSDELASDALHPGLRALLESEGGGALVDTLETYLDHAGDAKATAAALFIHRTSLYYRLGRIEQIAGVTLGDGNDRLALHLGLKVARLAGLRR